jgi:hypothetical protein
VHRFRFVAVSSLLVLAGCSSLLVLAGCSSAVGSAPPPDSLVPANETCLQTETDPSRLDPNGDLEPTAYPDPPAKVDETTVGEYVVSFEETYAFDYADGNLSDRLFLEYFLNESTVLRAVRYERDEDRFVNRAVRCE